MFAEKSRIHWRHADAASVVRHAELTGALGRHLNHLNSDRAFAMLLAAGADEDALRFLAYGLPARRAVGWGCLCIEHSVGDRLDSKNVALLKATMSWAMHPSDEHCKAVEAAANQATDDSPAASLAMAAAWSTEGREGRQNCIANMTDPAVVPLMVTNAIVAALADEAGAQMTKDFVALGIDVLHEPMHAASPGRNSFQSQAR